MHPASFGTYSTTVPEDRLFIEDGTKLRCDLFFASADQGKLVAPKGSRVSQTVPPFVWQYSGLLPVSDYLKTVALHSVSSEDKERAWQDVQLTFYNGLRAEGARDHEAKVAYAGAYAFAPRWPLVEFVDITDPERDKESRLYRVEYIMANPKGVSIEEYRTLVEDIVANSEAVSLSDIRGIIDAADAAKAEGSENSSWLQKIWRNEAPADTKTDAKSVQAEEELQTAAIDTGNNLGVLFASEKKLMAARQADMEKTEIGNVESEATSKAMVDELDLSEADEIKRSGGNGVPVVVEELEELPMAAEQSGNDLGAMFASEKMSASDEIEDVAESAVVVDNNVIETDVIVEDAITDEVADETSVSEQLAEADQQVLMDDEKPAMAADEQVSVEDEGELVDLDLILLDEQVPDEALVEEKVMDTMADPQEQKDWTVMPDGSEVLEIVTE